ncbi:sensor histidine kinase [Methanobacterium sp.]|uniref:sensor histidine kinase n=1 Tax=Methanobacterium sp. TaxID=2164 RepID=UPI003C78100D
MNTGNLKQPSSSESFNELINLNKELSKRNIELENALDEKEILLKEIFHKFKNNLMVISSLLNLQSRYIKDKKALEIFQKSQNRAKTMALIYEKLYQSSDIKKINFGEYIQSATNDIFYLNDLDLITPNLNVENIMLDINFVAPLGLILNELICNCIKHAFPHGMVGNITINFHKTNGKYELIVKDDGIGFPDDLDYKDTNSLGLRLVNMLVDQIDGTIKVINDNGTTFTIYFKE